jgi:hypothetical protein
LLSGEFFEPLGRSSSHQIWSSAMVLTPALRGLFGLDWDALHRTLRLAPNLPAEWDSARLTNVPLGETRLEIEYRRDGGRLLVTARSAKPDVVCLAAPAAPRDRMCSTPPSTLHDLALDLPPVEISVPHGLPAAGSETVQLKVTDERFLANQATFVLEASGGTDVSLPVRLHRAGTRISGAELGGGRVRVRFPQGPGYKRALVTFSW